MVHGHGSIFEGGNSNIFQLFKIIARYIEYIYLRAQKMGVGLNILLPLALYTSFCLCMIKVVLELWGREHREKRKRSFIIMICELDWGFRITGHNKRTKEKKLSYKIFFKQQIFVKVLVFCFFKVSSSRSCRYQNFF